MSGAGSETRPLTIKFGRELLVTILNRFITEVKSPGDFWNRDFWSYLAKLLAHIGHIWSLGVRLEGVMKSWFGLRKRLCAGQHLWGAPAHEKSFPERL